MVVLALTLAAVDPITAIFARDWAAVGGWGLFFSLTMFVVIGAFRETWVPGARHRRVEATLEKTISALQVALDQNSKLIASNEITKHFFEEITPRRGETSSRPPDGTAGS